MSYVQYDTPHSPLGRIIQEVRAGEVDPAVVNLRNGEASATVRLVGGHVLSANVISPRTKESQQLLYAGDDLRDPKLRASHVGCPAVRDGFGIKNNHGAARYAPHEISDRTNHGVKLRARLGAIGIRIERDIWLAPDKIIITDSVENMREEGTEATSLLSHLYLRRGEADPSDEAPILINGQTIDDLLKEKGAGENAIAGRPYFWPGFADTSSAVVGMPDGSQTKVFAMTNSQQLSGALIWAPPGEKAFCLEPVVGLSGIENPVNNRGQIIPPGEIGILTVAVSAA
jgi:hypothetical protein